MNPNVSSKPVMDVSAPRPLQQPTAPAPGAGAIAVQPAPLSSFTAEPARPKAKPEAAPVPLPPLKPEARLPQVDQPKTGAPVGVITVAVLVMMLLSASAVIVYVTSQTA